MDTNLLAIPLRTTKSIDIGSGLKKCLEEYYEMNTGQFNGDIHYIGQLRNNIINIEYNRKTLTSLTQYFIYLSSIMFYFPIDIDVEFVWYNSLGYSQSSNMQRNIQFERINVLYSILSIFSYLACDNDKNTLEGLKVSCSYFQFAAAGFHYIENEMIPNLRINPPIGLDEATLNALKYLMLAQAQECYWRRAMSENLKDSLIAKLSTGVASFYEQCLHFIMKSPIFRSDWVHFVTLKKYHFEAAAQFRIASDSLSKKKYGLQVAHLKSAVEIVNSVKSHAKYVPKRVEEDFKGLCERLYSDLDKAEKDNDLLYLDPVPSICTLPIIKPTQTASLQYYPPIFKSTEGNSVTIVEPDVKLFNNVIPYTLRQVAAIFKERALEMAKKDVQEEIDKLNDSMRSVLVKLDLPGSLQAVDKPVELPQSIIEHSTSIKENGGSNTLFQASQDNLNSSFYCFDLLNQAYASLEAIKNHPNIEQIFSLNSNIYLAFKNKLDEYQKNYETLQIAKSSDEVVKTKLINNKPFFDLLNQPVSEIESQIPKSTPTHLNIQLRDSIRTVNEYLEQCAILEIKRKKHMEMLERKIQNDNIIDDLKAEYTKLPLSSLRDLESFNFEEVINRRLKAYDENKHFIEKEREIQNNLLHKLETANIQFQASRITDDSVSRRTQALQQLEQSYNQYILLISNLNSGRKFYDRSMRDLTAFKEKCQELAYNIKNEDTKVRNNDQMDNVPQNTNQNSSHGHPLWDQSKGIQFGSR